MVPGLLLIALAAVAWGTTGAAMTLLGRDSAAGPVLVGWARCAIAAPGLLVALRLWRRGAEPAPRRSAGALVSREARATVVLGLAMAAYQICYFSAVTLVGVAVAALLAICSAPLMIALLAALVLGERPGLPVHLALVMAVAGTGLLLLGPRGLGGTSGHSALGAALALGAGLSYAVYAVTAKGLLARREPLQVATVTFGLAAVFLAPALLWEPAILPPLRSGWALLLYLGLGPTALAYVLFAAGLRRVPATVAGITTLLEPLTATTLGLVIFGERLGIVGAVGAGLLLASLPLLMLAPKPTA